MRRRAPRRVGLAVEPLAGQLAPVSLLADVQSAWASAVGAAIAGEAQPVAERGGVLTVSCSSAVWAHELDLLGPSIVDGLNQRLEGAPVRGLRCRVG